MCYEGEIAENLVTLRNVVATVMLVAKAISAVLKDITLLTTFTVDLLRTYKWPMAVDRTDLTITECL